MPAVFIPTRNRAELVERVLPKWLEQPVDELFIVCEKWEKGKYRRVAGSQAEVLVLPKTNQGINYARNWIVNKAHGMGYDRIIMSDDDLFPRPGYDVRKLLELDDLPALGMGIMLPFYGLMFGNENLKIDAPLMSLGGLGKRLFSLDTERALSVGNFDVRLYSGWGDDELVRQGIFEKSYTWYIHGGVHGTSIAGRHTPGGLNDLNHESNIERTEAEYKCHKIIYKKWPSYVSKPKLGGRLICQWKKMFNDFVPDWEQRITWHKA